MSKAVFSMEHSLNAVDAIGAGWLAKMHHCLRVSRCYRYSGNNHKVQAFMCPAVFCLWLLVLWLPATMLWAATPVISSQPPSTIVRAGQPYQYQIQAEDPDGKALSYNVSAEPPLDSLESSVISATGLINWTPQPEDIGTVTLTVRVTDEDGEQQSQAIPLNVLSSSGEPAKDKTLVVPSLPGSLVFSVVKRDTIAPVITIISPENNVTLSEPELTITGQLSERATLAIEGANVSVASDLSFTHALTLTSEGDTSILLEAQDPFRNRGTATLTVNLQSNSEPRITSTAVTSATQNTPYRYQVVATDDDEDSLTYSLETGPQGLTIDAQTGLINWQPAELGSFPVSVMVSDGRNGSAEQDFVITVNELNVAPVFTSQPITQAFIGMPYSYLAMATDGNSDPLTFSLVTNPAGMTIDASTGVVSWIPTAAQIGNHTVTVHVSDDESASAEQTFTVAINGAPVIVSEPVTTAAVDIAYQYQLNTTDINNDVLTYSLGTPTAGNIALGLTIDPQTGIVEWLPADIGIFSVVLIATDPSGESAEQAYDITVSFSDDNQPPVLNPLQDQQVPLTQSITGQLIASDPEGQALRYTVNNNVVPEGLTLNGETGEFSFTASSANIGVNELVFTVSDGRFSASQTMIITVPEPSSDAPTRFIGRILDAERLAKGDEIPIVGARVEFLNTGVSTFTDDNGDFTLTDIPTEGAGSELIFAIDGSTARPAPGGALYASFREALHVISHFDNVIERPFSMPRIAKENTAQVIPTQSTVLTNDDIGAMMVVPANTAMNEDGSQFTGQLAISEVPRDLAPVSLPANLDPTLLITIQPAGVVFDTPVPITLPNSDGFAPGSEVDIFSLDPETGVFGATAVGRVTADGKYIETIEGGIERADWHMTVISVIDDILPTDDDDNEQPCEQQTGSSTCLRDGCLTNHLALPHYRSLEGNRAIGMTYRSKRTNNPKGIPRFGGSGSGGGAGGGMGFKVTYRQEFVRGGGGGGNVPNLLTLKVNLWGQQSQTVHIDADQELTQNQAEDSEISLPVDLRGMETGIYPVDITASNRFTSGSRFGATFTTDVMVVNEQDSHFGAGWMLNGLSKLVIKPFIRVPSVMQINPNGNHLKYLIIEGSNEHTSPRGDFSTLVKTDNGYTHTDKYGNQTFYTSEGRQERVVDRNGNSTRYIYDSNGYLIQIIDPVGLSTQFSYRAGRIASITDPAGRTSTFEHDADGNLLSVTYPDATRTQYRYANSLMVQKIDERNNVTQYHYNKDGRNIRVTLPDTTTRKIGPQLELSQIDPLVTGTVQNPANLFAAGDSKATFEDARGNERSVVLSDLNRGTFSIDEIGRITNTVLNNDGLTTEVTRPNGSVYSQTYDALGNMTQRREHVNDAQYTYVYDNRSLITSFTNPRGHTTTIQRDLFGNPTEITNHLGHTTTLEHDERGLVTRSTSPNNLVTEYTYNDQGLVDSITQTPPEGSPGQTRITRYSYHETGLVKSLTTPDNITYVMEYDQRSRPLGYTDNLNQSMQVKYDAYGNVTEMVTTNGDSTPALMAAYDYDSRNRQIQMAMPHLANEQSIIRYALDGESNMISLTDPRNNKTFNVFDKAHRLVQNTHRLGGVSRYEYDDLDRVTKVVAPNGVTTHYTYDLLGRRLSEISADRGNLSYEYDLANNLIRSTDGRGIETRYTYDELERPTSKTFPGNPAEDVTFTYDTCTLGLGYLCDVTDESGQHAYEYDAFGNIVSQSKTELEQLYTTQYQYDNGDNLIGMTYPSGRTVTLGRDGVRRIASITTQVNNQPQTVISNQQYRGDNLMTQCTYGNGLIDTRTYDLQGRLRSQSLGNASNNIIDQRSYVYDVNANIIKRDSTPQLSDYQYDALDRLIGDAIDNDISHNHQYDLAHNRISKGQEGVNQAQYSYQPLSNRLLTSEQSDSSPDESGFTRLVPRRTTYNHANRRTEVVELESDTLLASYIYNAKGQRTRKTTATGTTVYHYDLYGQLISETTDTGELIKDYIWNGMTPAAQIDNAIQRDEEGTIQSQTETLHYLHSDHLYTTRFITNNNRNIVWRWEGQAFGESAVIESDEPGDKIAFNLRFPGQYYDDETNSYYNYFRDYDASLGRYLQSDPIGLDGGVNTYGYVEGNPLSSVDPQGLCPCAIPLLFGGGAILAGGAYFSANVENISNALGNLVDSLTDSSSESNNNGCLVFYRGDFPGKTEFWANESGAWARDMLESNPLDYLMQKHSIDSDDSMFISITTNPKVAQHFGEVYRLTLPEGMAFPNPHNRSTLPNTNISEDEWLVPFHIPSQHVNNPNCKCN